MLNPPLFAQESPPAPPASEPSVQLNKLDAAASQMVGDDSVQLDAPVMPQPNYDAAELVEPIESPGGAQPSKRWKVLPHFDARVTYDDNIFIQPTHPVADVIFTAAPGIALGFWDSDERFETFLFRDRRASRVERIGGNFLIADYTASILAFTHTSSENTVNQDAVLEGQWSTAKLTITGEARFVSGLSADIDVGGLVHQRIFTATIGARYDFTERLFFESSVTFTDSQPEGFASSMEWRTDDWANYQISPKVAMGLGATFGHVELGGGGSETFEQARLRASYTATEKLSAVASAGVEFRQNNGAGGDQTTPVFSLGLTYTPREGTIINVEAFRQIANSALVAGQDYTITGARARIRHFLWRGIYLTLAAGYEVSDYNELVLGQSRQDRYWYVQPGLLYNFAHWGNVQLFYLHRTDASNLETYSFVDNQFECQLSLTF